MFKSEIFFDRDRYFVRKITNIDVGMPAETGINSREVRILFK